MGSFDAQRLRQLQNVPENLFHDPLEYLAADHYRQNYARRLLNTVITDARHRTTPDMAAIGALFHYFNDDFPHHMADEEDDLYPTLLAKGGEHDKSVFRPLMCALCDGHNRLERVRAKVCTHLDHVLTQGRINNDRFMGADMGKFSEILRWVVDLEERIILPFARTHITADELGQLGQSMAQRRNAIVPAYLI